MTYKLRAMLLFTTSLLLTSLQLQSYDQKDLNNEIIIAANWQQLSAEYEAYLYQVFNSAQDRLKHSLTKVPKGKRPAIITDIDDTLIANTSYFSSLVGTQAQRNVERSIQFWTNQEPKALPGSVEFLKAANQMGIEIFYISGRFNTVKDITINQLKSLGFPVKSHQHVLLQEENNKTLNKQEKRQLINEKNYFPMMLIGDQLSDFEDTSSLASQNSRDWVLHHLNHFGQSWFLLPNVVYGQWEEIISLENHATTPEQIHQARAALTTNHHTTSRSMPESYLQHIILADTWIQHSANFTATAIQTYNLAKEALDNPENLSKPNKAIVTDIDGTVIQYPPIHLTPPFCHKFGSPEDKMKDYVRQFNSPPVPGAREFLEKAQQLGYEIFFVTARDHSSGRANNDGDIASLTLAQLEANGMPISKPQNLLNRSSFCPEGRINCEKHHQRAAITSGKINNTEYEITLFIGDFLNDLNLYEQDLSPVDKTSVAKTHHLFGRKYFLIPNPVNKTWMWWYYSSIAGKNACSLTEQERADLRIELLEDWKNKTL